MTYTERQPSQQGAGDFLKTRKRARARKRARLFLRIAGEKTGHVYGHGHVYGI